MNAHACKNAPLRSAAHEHRKGLEGTPDALWQKVSLLLIALPVLLSGALLLEVGRLVAAGDVQNAIIGQSLRTIHESDSVWASFNRYNGELQAFTSAALTGIPASEAQSLQLSAARGEIARDLSSLGRSSPLASLRPQLVRYFTQAAAAELHVLHGNPHLALALEASQLGCLADRVDATLRAVRQGGETQALTAQVREHAVAQSLGLQILLAVVLTVMTSAFAARYLTRRLAALTLQATAVSRGEGDIKLGATRFPDEIVTLTQTLAAMTTDLRLRAEEIRVTQWQVLEELVTTLEQRDAYSAGTLPPSHRVRGAPGETAWPACA